jgi:hypothetical protein
MALTMYLGPEEILLNLEVNFKNDLMAGDIEAAVQRLEVRIREQHPDVGRIFIEATALSRSARRPPRARSDELRN